MEHNLEQFNLVFDIGANIGNTVDYLLTRSQKIICFEPIPSLAEHLKRRYKNKNVEVVQKGLSNFVGTKTFFISNMGGVLSTFATDWIDKSRFTNRGGKWSENITVITTTLDTILQEYGIPDFIKIDVEGYEFEVFQGLTQLLENTLFGFEWAEELFTSTEKIISYVKELGYTKFAYTNGDNLREIDNLEFKNWSELEIHKIINPNQKTNWGMIYFKK